MRKKVTLEEAKAKIISVQYVVDYFGGKTIAKVHLKNGTCVRGESDCLKSSLGLESRLGEKSALENATRKILELEEYLLTEEIYQNDCRKKHTGTDNATTNINEAVDHPEHYASAGNGIECIDAIEAALGREQFIGFLRGQVIKYQWRMGKKDNAAQDNDKSIWYASKLAEIMKGQQNEL